MKTAFILVVLGLLASLSAPLHAQTKHVSTSVSGQIGEPRATFDFDDNLQLTVECDQKTGWFVTNLGVYGQEAIGSFTLLCGSVGAQFTVNNTPLTVTVAMYYESGPDYGQYAGSVTLQVNSAEFTEALRYHPSTGSATITF